MLRSFVLNKYIAGEFLKITLIITFGFFCLGIIINLFEEINFVKEKSESLYLPILLTLLIMPNLIFNFFPFIILFASIWLFLRLTKTDEIVVLKSSGFSNMSIITIPVFVGFLLGIIFVTAISPVTSALVKKYETIKGSFSDDQNYLAAITTNGIWIKETQKNVTNIIRSSHLDKNKLINVSIYQFNDKNDLLLRIETESADISSNLWKLSKVRTYETSEENSTIVKKSDNMIFKSIYNIDRIRNLYSNIDTVSFWNLKGEIEVLQERGYSTKQMRGKFQESIAFPFLLISMSLLAGVFTLGIKFKGNNWAYVYFAILSCVVVYFFSDFSAALGETEKLPVAISVWMPVSIVFIFSTVGLIHVNRK